MYDPAPSAVTLGSIGTERGRAWSVDSHLRANRPEWALRLRLVSEWLSDVRRDDPALATRRFGPRSRMGRPHSAASERSRTHREAIDGVTPFTTSLNGETTGIAEPPTKGVLDRALGDRRHQLARAPRQRRDVVSPKAARRTANLGPVGTAIPDQLVPPLGDHLVPPHRDQTAYRAHRYRLAGTIWYRLLVPLRNGPEPLHLGSPAR
jgi:hypothetical protein